MSLRDRIKQRKEELAQSSIGGAEGVSPLAQHNLDFQESELPLMDALSQGAENIGPSFQKMGQEVGHAFMNPQETLPAMAQGVHGLGQMLGIAPQGGGGDITTSDGEFFSTQPPDLTGLGNQLWQGLIEPYKSYDNFKQTIATDPARPITDVLGTLIGFPGTQAVDKIVKSTTRTLPKALMEHALAGKNRITPKALTEAADEMLKNGRTVSKKGLEQLKTEGSIIGNQIGDILDELENANGMLDLEQVAEAIKVRGIKEANSPLTADVKKMYNDTADEMLEWAIENIPEVNETGTFMIPAAKVREYKKVYSKRLEDFYNKILKDGDLATADKAKVMDTARKTHTEQQVALARELGIENLDELNWEYYKLKVQQDLVDNVLEGWKRENWVPSDVTVPLAVETAAKGGPGVATAIGLTRRAVSRYESPFANLIYRMHKPATALISGSAGVAEGNLLTSYLESRRKKDEY